MAAEARATGSPRTDPAARVALLTPYSGTNLGDAAIQESVIRHLRRRLPDVRISGITLDAALTSRRHGIPCVPIAGVPVEFYFSRPASAAPAPDVPGAAMTGARRSPGTARARLKSLPLLGPSLRVAARFARRVWAVRLEAPHLARSWTYARGQDLILASGGGQIDDEWGGPWGHPYALFKWACLARLAGARFALASVGVGRLDRRLSRWFVRRALGLAAYRSYRDAGSKAMLGDVALTRGDPCVPDLALGLDAPGAGSGGGVAARIGVSPIAFGDPDRWPTEKRQVFERYLAELTAFVRWLAGRGDEVVLFASSGSDRSIASGIVREVASAAEAGGQVARVRRADDATLDALLSELAALDLVVASRLHGVILAHLLGKPVLAVSFDRKVEAHMDDFGQRSYCLHIASVSRAELHSGFERLRSDATLVRERIRSAAATARRAVDAQFDQLADLATGSHRP